MISQVNCEHAAETFDVPDTCMPQLTPDTHTAQLNVFEPRLGSLQLL